MIIMITLYNIHMAEVLLHTNYVNMGCVGETVNIYVIIKEKIYEVDGQPILFLLYVS